MATFVQDLFTGQGKAAGTVLAISGSLTVTAGNYIYVAFASDDGGSGFGITDNLGNTYGLVKEQINTGNVKTQLWRAPITTGGTLTTITVTWTTDVSAKAAAAGEYADIGTERLTDGVSANGSNATMIQSNTFFSGELWIGAIGSEGPEHATTDSSMGTPSQTIDVRLGSNTTGGGAASNIGCSLVHALIGADSSANGTMLVGLGATRDYAGAGAIYNTAAAPTFAPPPPLPYQSRPRFTPVRRMM